MAGSEVHRGKAEELSGKLARLRDFLSRHALDGAMFWTRANFAWITCGLDNHIVGASPIGEAAIVVVANDIFCFCNSIESPRLRLEELVGTGIRTIDFPWYDPGAARKRFSELTQGGRVACDIDHLNLGLPLLPGDYKALRQTLCEPEIRRYRETCHDASRAVERACHDLTPGMTEHEIAGVLDHHVRSAGLKAHVTLVGCDERIERFRHPIPTEHRLRRHAMLVTCAERGGLIANLTRFVHFGTPSAETVAMHKRACEIDACVIEATSPGRTLADIFGELRRAYQAAGFPDEWQNHHQGGLTGYATRELVATPNSDFRVACDQTYAWNPSLPGAKSEDTILVSREGYEVLTAASSNWPMVPCRRDTGFVNRPGILIR